MCVQDVHPEQTHEWRHCVLTPQAFNPGERTLQCSPSNLISLFQLDALALSYSVRPQALQTQSLFILLDSASVVIVKDRPQEIKETLLLPRKCPSAFERDLCSQTIHTKRL
jgi:hypothetical protein